MYEVLYLIKSLAFLVSLGAIKAWTFGGFGLDKTYVLIFFAALVQFLVNLVLSILTTNYLGLYNRLFLQFRRRITLSSVISQVKHFKYYLYRTLGGLFVEPLLAMIMGDFMIRLCLLRN